MVARQSTRFSVCLPLVTHRGLGAKKFGTDWNNYAAVYDSSEAPIYSQEEKLTKEPFPIVVERPGENIDCMSRLHFGRPYTVEHNLRVLNVGRIPDEYIHLFKQYFLGAMASEPPNETAQPSTPVSSLDVKVTNTSKSPVLAHKTVAEQNLAGDIPLDSHPLGTKFEYPTNLDETPYNVLLKEAILKAKYIRKQPTGKMYEELDDREFGVQTLVVTP